jgi:DNA-binding MarR family transcriptional regulator
LKTINNDGAPLAAPDTLDFTLRLARAYALLTRRLDGPLGSLHGLSFSDFQLLDALERTPRRRLRRIDLANAVGLTASGVTRTLMPLEKIGLVTRESDARDARVGYAVLTSAGRRVVREARVTVAQVSADVLEDADMTALDSLMQATNKLGT